MTGQKREPIIIFEGESNTVYTWDNKHFQVDYIGIENGEVYCNCYFSSYDRQEVCNVALKEEVKILKKKNLQINNSKVNKLLNLALDKACSFGELMNCYTISKKLMLDM